MIIIQDQLNEKIITLIIKSSEISARTFLNATKKTLKLMFNTGVKGGKAILNYRGKTSVKKLVRKSSGVSNIEITDDNIKCFEPYARKYGIKYALSKDITTTPPRWMVFFKASETDVITAAFKEFTAKTIKQNQNKKPSVIKALKQTKELVSTLAQSMVKSKDRGIEL